MSTSPSRVEVDGFEAWVNRDREALVRFAVLVSHGHPDAEDLCHDVLLRLRERFAQFEDERAAARYARRAIANAVVDRHRRQTRERGLAGRVGRTERVDRPTERPDPVGSAVADADTRTALGLLNALTPHERAAVVLRVDEGLPYAEVASVLGMSTIAARSTVSRALRRLRRLLEEQDHA